MHLRRLSAEAAISVFGKSLFRECFVWVPSGTSTKQIQARLKKDYPHLTIANDYFTSGKYAVLPAESTNMLYDVPAPTVASISPTLLHLYKDFFVVDDFCWVLYHKELCT